MMVGTKNTGFAESQQPGAVTHDVRRTACDDLPTTNDQ